VKVGETYWARFSRSSTAVQVTITGPQAMYYRVARVTLGHRRSSEVAAFPVQEDVGDLAYERCSMSSRLQHVVETRYLLAPGVYEAEQEALQREERATQALRRDMLPRFTALGLDAVVARGVEVVVALRLTSEQAERVLAALETDTRVLRALEEVE